MGGIYGADPSAVRQVRTSSFCSQVPTDAPSLPVPISVLHSKLTSPLRTVRLLYKRSLQVPSQLPPLPSNQAMAPNPSYIEIPEPTPGRHSIIHSFHLPLERVSDAGTQGKNSMERGSIMEDRNPLSPPPQFI